MAQSTLDPNRHAYRPDVADIRLEGRVESERFVDGMPMTCANGVAAVRAEPNADAEQSTQLLFGEGFAVFDTDGDWAWGQSARDGYVGFVRADALAAGPVDVTHRVVALLSFLFVGPSLKRPPLETLPFNAQVRVDGEDGDFVRLATGGWLHGKHVAPLAETAPDPAATALRFVGVPYLWGGRTALGLDCSGLVQTALHAAGLDAPRDTYMQADEIGEDLPIPNDAGALRRNDLVFLPGHVGIADGDGHLIHANGHDGMVSVHRLDDVLEREHRLRGNAISRVRRPYLPAA